MLNTFEEVWAIFKGRLYLMEKLSHLACLFIYVVAFLRWLEIYSTCYISTSVYRFDISIHIYIS